MRRTFKVFVACAAAATALTTTSCDKFLDVNQNPNNPTTTVSYSILANALKVTADNLASYNGYAEFAAGYWAKTSIVNGYNEERTYNYNSLYNQGLFSGTYDNLEDYDQVIKRASAEGNTANLAIIAKIMKVYNYQLLVDEYGDVPYSQSLQGLGNIKPQYDRAEDIYKDLVLKLDEAVTEFANLPAGQRTVGTEDIVFAGGANANTNWTRFAQTLKLRLLMRMSTAAQTNSSLQQFLQAEFAKYPAGVTFVSSDVVVQPGYLQSAGKQNAFWERYGRPLSTSTNERTYVQPSNYILNQYRNGTDGRLARLYTPNSAGVYVGNDLGATTLVPAASSSTNRLNGGLLKGYDMAQPLMLNAESQFLQAEAKLRGYLAGGDAGAKTNYESGIAASFNYFYTPAASQRGTTNDLSATAATAASTYLSTNATNPLVNWDAPGSVTKYQKIYFQKYLALNGALPVESWSEVRRNDYPAIKPSLQSTSPRADGLPVRLLYPQTEVATNGSNVPTGINQFTSRIFWDVN